MEFMPYYADIVLELEGPEPKCVAVVKKDATYEKIISNIYVL